MDENIVELRLSDNTYAKVHKYGATVISWVNKGTEQLFLSTKSKMDGTKAIRGGIPVVFPNFGPWDCGPQHGFARISWWKMEAVEKLSNSSAKATFILEDNEQTKSMWDHSFRLTYEVILQPNTLTTSLEIHNTGSKSFDFTTLLHTYFRVSDISQSTVTGFGGCKYNDKVTSQSGQVEDRESISIKENVDRVYIGPKCHVITSPGRKVRVEKENLEDTVLWNPWSQKAKEMSDFDDDGYLNMVCVEPGYVSQRKILNQGEKLKCSQSLTVIE